MRCLWTLLCSLEPGRGELQRPPIMRRSISMGVDKLGQTLPRRRSYRRFCILLGSPILSAFRSKPGASDDVHCASLAGSRGACLSRDNDCGISTRFLTPVFSLELRGLSTRPTKLVWSFVEQYTAWIVHMTTTTGFCASRSVSAFRLFWIYVPYDEYSVKVPCCRSYWIKNSLTSMSSKTLLWTVRRKELFCSGAHMP